MKRALLAMAIASFSFNAVSAQPFSNGPTWNYAEVGYQTTDIDGLDEFEPAGFSVKGTTSIGEKFFLTASYRDLSDDEMGLDLDMSQFSAGVGYRYSVTRSTDIFGIASFENLDVEASGPGGSVGDDESGFGIAAGVRSMVIDQLELSVTAKHIELDDTGDTGIEAGATFYITPSIAFGATYEKLDDFSFAGANIRYSF
ncbi:outer membrane beta-barrel protein [Salinimonas chungwhensis]|uniref:outer membrane beta-barrel protein n=1 Tax=Salinimonas chungwhensis TaxID=265425 RepID=UPI00035E7D5F|nr:outer membrane beta-barrel protein [Salinimonas chungwhensis]